MNGQIEAVCESVFSEMESQAVDALDLPMTGCFRMRSHSYVRAIEKGCSQEEEEEATGRAAAAGGGASRKLGSPPRSATTVRTIQSSTGWSLTFSREECRIRDVFGIHACAWKFRVRCQMACATNFSPWSDAFKSGVWTTFWVQGSLMGFSRVSHSPNGNEIL